MNTIRGEVAGFNRYANPVGGAGKMTASVDPSQYAAALQMVKVATDNMQAQFAQFQRIFDARG